MADEAVVRATVKKASRWAPKQLGGPVLVLPMAFWMVAFFVVPLFLIFAYSFGTQGVYDNAPSLGFNTEWYRLILTQPEYRKAFYVTAKMVLFNTGGCLLIGFPLAYFISVKSGKRKTLFVLLVMLPFWTNFLIRTFAWKTILDDGGLINGWLVDLHMRAPGHPYHMMSTNGAVYAGLIYDYLPFMVLPLFVSIEKIHKSLFEASKDLGAGKWTTLMKVTLPLSMPGIFAGCMLTAIPTTGEFVIPNILGGGKVVSWGWLIERAFGQGRNWPLGSALSNLLLVFMMIVIVFYARAVSKGDF